MSRLMKRAANRAPTKATGATKKKASGHEEDRGAAKKRS